MTYFYFLKDEQLFLSTYVDSFGNFITRIFLLLRRYKLYGINHISITPTCNFYRQHFIHSIFLLLLTLTYMKFTLNIRLVLVCWVQHIHRGAYSPYHSLETHFKHTILKDFYVRVCACMSIPGNCGKTIKMFANFSMFYNDFPSMKQHISTSFTFV